MRHFYALLVLCLAFVRIGAQTPVRYCIENEITHGFLNDFSYDSLDLTVSYVMDYFNKPHDYRLDAPSPVKLSWTHADGAEAQRVEISEKSDYSDPIKFTIDKDASEYDLYNMIPGKVYYYRILSTKGGTDTQVADGQIEPYGKLRWLLAQGTWNVRDAGGWIGLGGNPIKYGKIFRGAQLRGKGTTNILLTKAGIEAMRNAGIRAELDLRSKDQAPSPVSAISVNVGGKEDVDYLLVPESSGARMVNFTKTDVTIKELQWVIDELKAGKPVYFHCQNGADRTGTLGFLIGALLGMNESDLAKDYELTTFCEVDAAAYDPTEKGFARLRNYEGKKGSPLGGGDNPDEYKYALLAEKMNDYVATKDGATYGTTYQRVIYNFFKNGNGSKSSATISEDDLGWFITYMTDYVLAREIKSYSKPSRTKEFKPGETFSLNVALTPANANGKIKYTSSNPDIATVSENGVVTAVRGGTAKITFEIDGLFQTVNFKVQAIESPIPVSTEYNGARYFISDKNTIKNGSFEYGGSYTNWKTANGAEMSDAGFSVKTYGSGRYIESKLDGDDKSAGSIRTEWGLYTNRIYVFGYKVKNSTSQKNVNNENLKVMSIKYGESDESKGKVLEGYPTYDGNWTDVQYIFRSSAEYDACRVVFTHLSNDSNNTCFDDFYLCELDTVTGVKNIILPQFDGESYRLNDHILIKEGKKYLNK